MSALRLTPHRVAKPWGRTDIRPEFDIDGPVEGPIGEIWFTGGHEEDPELLVKYLFTTERLSVQVHPDGEGATARGLRRGKDEAWLVIDAEADSTIALGPTRPLMPQQLRQAARDGSIVNLLDWRPVRKGDFIYSAAGTIHAIGSGLTLLEIQQNLDLTYRLYDYGRPRDLHLEDAVAVADLEPFRPHAPPQDCALLAEGPQFVVERLAPGRRAIASGEASVLLVPISGHGSVDGRDIGAGQCWSLKGTTEVLVDDGANILIAYPGDRKL